MVELRERQIGRGFVLLVPEITITEASLSFQVFMVSSKEGRLCCPAPPAETPLQEIPQAA